MINFADADSVESSVQKSDCSGIGGGKVGGGLLRKPLRAEIVLGVDEEDVAGVRKGHCGRQMQAKLGFSNTWVKDKGVFATEGHFLLKLCVLCLYHLKLHS